MLSVVMFLCQGESILSHRVTVINIFDGIGRQAQERSGVRLCTYSIVKCCLLTEFINFFSSTFPMILDITVRRLIGRYDVTSIGGLPGLRMSITSATFHCAGKYLGVNTA